MILGVQISPLGPSPSGPTGHLPRMTGETYELLSGINRACRPAEPMSDSAFESLANSLLAALEEGIGPHADAELQGGVLTVEGNHGTWLVNKHAPTQQIWLSSPQSGARHYAYDAGTGQWKDTRGGPDLIAHLSGELGVPLTWQAQ
jgi:frataxin